jgi:hypothetical protein
MFGHILSVVHPKISAGFYVLRDAVITVAFGAIQGLPEDPTTSTHDMPVVAGEAGLPSLGRIAFAIYLGAFFRVA